MIHFIKAKISIFDKKYSIYHVFLTKNEVLGFN